MNKPYKRNITESLPPNAEVLTKNGRLVARWTDDKGKIRQAKVVLDRKGSQRIVVGQDEKWTIAFWTPSGRKTRVAYKDYESSLSLLQRLEREASQRAEGIITGFDDHRKTAIGTHLDDFMVNAPRKTASDRYLGQHRGRIERIIGGTGATRLHDLDPVKIDRFFAAEKISGHTRNEYIGSITAFTKWAVKNRRIERDPLLNLHKTPRNLIKPEHPRRAITIDQFHTLLDVAQRRPLLEMLLVRKGKDKGTYSAKVSERAKAKAQRIGADRRLAYQLGMWTCLRRNEIKQLRWSDIDLDADRPVIRLRAHTTKGRRADVVEIFPDLFNALSTAKAKGIKHADPVVLNVPSIQVIKADLAMANLPYEDDNGFADFHSLRMCCNTWMAVRGVSLSARQKHLRHTDPRLTAITYIDAMHISAASELFPPATETAVKTPPTSTSDEQQAKLPTKDAGLPTTALMQRTVGPGGQAMTTKGKGPTKRSSRRGGDGGQQQRTKQQGVGHDLANEDAGWQDPASSDDQERVKGVEPSTFTLAT